MSPLTDTLQNMWKMKAKSYTVLLVAIALVGCSSELGASEVQEGIEWSLLSSARIEGVRFNNTSGRFDTEVDTSTGLARGAVVLDKNDPVVREALREEKESFCDSYTDPWGDDPYASQGYLVERVLLSTVNAAVSDMYTDELIAAIEDQFNFPEGGSLTEYWEENYSHLTKLRDTISEKRSELRAEAFTPEFVRETQNEIIAFCDITVPQDYEFPTIEQLDFPAVYLNDSASENTEDAAE